MQNFSKFLGARLSNFPLIILIILVIYNSLFIKKMVPKRTFIFFASVFLYALILGLMPILMIYNDLFYADFLYRTLFVTMMIIATKIFIMCYVVKNYKTEYNRYIIVAYFFTWIGYITCDVIKFDFAGFFHASIDPLMDRARGFSPEPSAFGTTAMILGLLSSWVQKRNFQKVSFLVLTFVLVILSSSKGAIAIMMIITYLMALKSKFNVWLKVLITILAFVGLVYIWDNFIIYLIGIGDENLYSTMSFTTRSSAMLTAIIVIKEFPLGMGPSAAYGIEFIKHIPDVYDFLGEVIGGHGLDALEISAMVHHNITDTSANISSKSGFFNNVMYFGLPFLLYFFYSVYKVQRLLYEKNERILWSLFLFIVFAIIFYTDVNYDSIFGISIALAYYYKYEPSALCFKWISKR